MEMLDDYGIDNLRKEFERYVDIEKPKLIKILNDKEYKYAIYESLKSIFNLRFRIYELTDNYINELIDLTKNFAKDIMSLGQQEALCEIDRITHPISSYPCELFEPSIIPHTLVIFPFNYTINIDQLQKYNPCYKLIMIKSKETEKVYVVMYREKSILTTNNPDITGFTEEEMNKIRKNFAS
jgi:hypothetical protein